MINLFYFSPFSRWIARWRASMTQSGAISHPVAPPQANISELFLRGSVGTEFGGLTAKLAPSGTPCFL